LRSVLLSHVPQIIQLSPFHLLFEIHLDPKSHRASSLLRSSMPSLPSASLLLHFGAEPHNVSKLDATAEDIRQFREPDQLGAGMPDGNIVFLRCLQAWAHEIEDTNAVHMLAEAHEQLQFNPSSPCRCSHQYLGVRLFAGDLGSASILGPSASTS